MSAVLYHFVCVCVCVCTCVHVSACGGEREDFVYICSTAAVSVII